MINPELSSEFPINLFLRRGLELLIIGPGTQRLALVYLNDKQYRSAT